MAKRQFEQLNEIQIAEIREIFTLFDKNSDGYVNTHELGTIVRALNLNPPQSKVKEYEKEVDPHDTGSFGQMDLISLIAKMEKKTDELEEMIQAVKTLANQDGTEQDKLTKISVDTLLYSLTNSGEKMLEPEVEEIFADCLDLIHDKEMLIDDFCNYLMSR